MTQKPTVGRIVHYQSYGTPGREYLPEPRAAIITEVTEVVDARKAAALAERAFTTNHHEDGTTTYVIDGVPKDAATLPKKHLVSVAVINPTGLFFKEDLPYAETPTPGHWNWPPRTTPTPDETLARREAALDQQDRVLRAEENVRAAQEQVRSTQGQNRLERELAELALRQAQQELADAKPDNTEGGQHHGR